ncbi:MAG: hypothetical protein U1D30_16870 [Planctomycetota bacterium]
MPAKFAIYDRGDQESLARSALRELKIETSKLKPGLFLSFVGQWKMKGMSPGQAETDLMDETEKLAWHLSAVPANATFRGGTGFDDLLLCTSNYSTSTPLPSC